MWSNPFRRRTDTSETKSLDLGKPRPLVITKWDIKMGAKQMLISIYLSNHKMVEMVTDLIFLGSKINCG